MPAGRSWTIPINSTNRRIDGAREKPLMAKKHSSSKSAQTKAKTAKKQAAQRRYWTWAGAGLGIIVLAVAAFFMIRAATAGAAEITPAQAFDKIQKGAFVLDVRTPQEWTQMRIAKSTLVPLEELQNQLGSLPKDRDIVVVCQSGGRSKEAQAMLQQAGFKRASSMAGGLDAWQAAGYPLEKAQ